MSALPSIRDNATPEEAEHAGALYEAYSGRILGYCLRRLPSREDAEDAVQHTFMNAFRGLRQGVVPRSEAAWLFKIAENVCRERRSLARKLDRSRGRTGGKVGSSGAWSKSVLGGSAAKVAATAALVAGVAAATPVARHELRSASPATRPPVAVRDTAARTP